MVACLLFNGYEWGQTDFFSDRFPFFLEMCFFESALLFQGVWTLVYSNMGGHPESMIWAGGIG